MNKLDIELEFLEHYFNLYRDYFYELTGKNKICHEKYCFSIINFWDIYTECKSDDYTCKGDFILYINRYNNFNLYIRKNIDYTFKEYLYDTKYLIYPIPKFNYFLNLHLLR